MVNIVIVADREYGVNVTPLIDMLPLFAKDSLDTVWECGQFHAKDIDGG